ncbi:putative PPE family protein PPE29 [Mycobacterium basiliense]|uniref:Putative PPE family protein PPE29 n=1 Tax=Mycobacterium basiliense TaxID=2094119 RepID=A0A447GEK3_9MYCO|nr:PPE family protein [Mycobacterium basiliense]VDM88893.1 putative PPE family protein PPE29 [Mycobacterium basiliense]
MAIDFGTLPPEVTSTMMYSGPGSSSMVAAASAWNALAAELASTAQGYITVLTQLASEEWLGPASGTMVQAVQPYVTWMTATAAQAEQAAIQARAAAAAFDTAFASVVPPPLIAANRAELAQALQTNLFGLNNGVIAQLEAQYAEMWAQDSSAMYSYAGSSAAATKVEAFSNAPEIANQAGTASQAAAVTAAQAGPAATVQGYLNQITSQLGQLATPAGTSSLVSQIGASNPILTEIWFLLTGQTVLPNNLGTFMQGYSNYASFFYNTEGLPYFSVGMGNFGIQMAKTAGLLNTAAPAAAAAIPTPPGIGGILGAGAGAGSQVAAGLGSGAHVGSLAVPASWPGATVASAVRPAVQAISEPITAPDAGAANVVGGMPVAGTGAGRGLGSGPKYGFKPTVMARPLPAG